MTILDLADEHEDTLFQIITNGLMMTPALFKKFAHVGNITPEISV